MSRFVPPVPSSRYRLAFVPVLSRGGGVREGKGEGEGDSGVGLDGSEGETAAPSHEEKQMRGHLLRSARYCWCDRDTRELMMKVCIYVLWSLL